MKVFQINTVYGKGSTGRIVQGVSDYLRKRGHQCISAYGVGDSGDPNTYKIGGRINYYTHNLLSRLLGHEGFYSKHATQKLIQYIDTFNPDIIHLHNIHGHYLHIPTLFKYLAQAGKPVFWTLHDCFPFTGKCVYFDMVKCDRWKTRCYHCPQLSEYPMSTFDASKLDHTKKLKWFNSVDIHYVLPSVWIHDLLMQSKLAVYNATVVHNGINTQNFNPKADIDAEMPRVLVGKFVVLGLASPWSERKGLPDFMALAKLLTELPDVQIVLVGLNNKQMRHLPQNILGIQHLDSPRALAALYARADVLFNPTYEDNYPTVNLEAYACGTPIVAYRTGGCTEFIQAQDAGVLVDPGDISATVLALTQIKASPKKQIPAANLVDIDEKTCFKNYVSLYEATKAE